MRKTGLVFCIISCIIWGMMSASRATDAFGLAAPEELSELDSLRLYATQYYIYKARDGGTIPLLDGKEKQLGYFLDTCDWCLAAIEGTIYLQDKNGKDVVLNYAGRSKELQVNCTLCRKLSGYKNQSIGKTLWSVSSGFGDGVSGYKLVPYRTIAVDPAQIPYGTVIYIPAARGKSIVLPDGSTVVHDGYFFAGDTGGDIKGNHIDVFTGVLNTNPFPEVVKSNSKETFVGYVVSDSLVVAGLKREHGE